MFVIFSQIEGNFKKPKVSLVLDDLTNETTYFIVANKTYRYPFMVLLNGILIYFYAMQKSNIISMLHNIHSNIQRTWQN